MKASVLISVLLVTAGCGGTGKSYTLPEPADAFELEAAKKDALRYLGDGSKVLAICGGSVGSSFFLEGQEKGFVEDGIKEGIIVFALRQDGSPDVLTRDALKEMIVATEDKGQVFRLHGRQNNDDLGVWVIQYPSTGVVVNHNLSKNSEGDLIDIWTQNKPRIDPLPARTSTFLSRCETRS